MSLEPNIIVAIIGAATTILAVLVKTVGERFFLRLTRLNIGDIQIEIADSDRQNLRPALDRLDEARKALSEQRATVKTNRLMGGLLTIGQYIVGGLLASSFVQQSLSREVVGALGLLVLLSSLLYQQFRPDLRLRGALGRALRLEAIIRQGEDDLYAMRSAAQGAPTVVEFRRRISQALSEIRASELQDITFQTAKTNENKAP